LVRFNEIDLSNWFSSCYVDSLYFTKWIMNASLVYCRIKHAIILDDPYDDPAGLAELVLDKSLAQKPPAEVMTKYFVFIYGPKGLKDGLDYFMARQSDVF
jgi:hypothetical protein